MVPFAEDSINQFLGYLLVLEEGQHYRFSERRSQALGFDEEAIGQLLCILGQDFTRSMTGRWVRIMHTSMTTLTQIWMTLLLSNILPNDHNSDLPLPKCQLVYAILTQVSIHVAQLNSDTIYQFVGITPPRHPMDPEKSNKALGFSALITGLCQFYGVPIMLTKLIRPPINWSFIEKYCMPRQTQQHGQVHQQQLFADAALPPLQQLPSLESISVHMQWMKLYMQYVADQQATNHRGQVQLNESFYQYTLYQQSPNPSPYSWPTPRAVRGHSCMALRQAQF